MYVYLCIFLNFGEEISCDALKEKEKKEEEQHEDDK